MSELENGMGVTVHNIDSVVIGPTEDNYGAFWRRLHLCSGGRTVLTLTVFPPANETGVRVYISPVSARRDDGVRGEGDTRPGERREYVLTDEQLEKVKRAWFAVSSAREWEELAEELGFDVRTVCGVPGKGERFFSALPVKKETSDE